MLKITIAAALFVSVNIAHAANNPVMPQLNWHASATTETVRLTHTAERTNQQSAPVYEKSKISTACDGDSQCIDNGLKLGKLIEQNGTDKARACAYGYYFSHPNTKPDNLVVNDLYTWLIACMVD